MIVEGNQEAIKNDGGTVLILARVIELVWFRNDQPGFVYWVSFSSTTTYALFLGPNAITFTSWICTGKELS